MVELRDELAAVQRETVSAAQVQRAGALFAPVWDRSSFPNAGRGRSMTRKIMGSGADASGADTPAQSATLSIPTHMAAPSHVLVLRDGPKPTRPPAGGLKRVDRLSEHYAEAGA